MDDDIDDDENYDIEELIQTVKLERQRQLKEHYEHEEKNKNAAHSRSHSHNNYNTTSTASSSSSSLDGTASSMSSKERNKLNHLCKLLREPVLDSASIRASCWRGIPSLKRGEIWRILLGYSSKTASRRQLTLTRKRKEYSNLIDRYYTKQTDEQRSKQENAAMSQIAKDIKRMDALFQIPVINALLSRTLYLWSLKHTASGYVQGIHDLMTPFVYVLIDECLMHHFNGLSLATDYEAAFTILNDSQPKLSKQQWFIVEADSYWCLDALIEGLQMNYIDKQPGITLMVQQLREVVQRLNAPLCAHLQQCQVEFFQFAYRWMNCLLMRELSMTHIIRLWDTYLCEGVQLSSGFTEFHVFVCAALLLSFSDKLRKMGFDEIILFLQDLKSVTNTWTEREIETVLSEAFVYQQLFGKQKQNNVF